MTQKKKFKLKLIDYTALALTLGGEAILMLGKPELVAIAYSFFLIGNLVWMRIAVKNNVKSLLVLNIIFFIMGLIGLKNWL